MILSSVTEFVRSYPACVIVCLYWFTCKDKGQHDMWQKQHNCVQQLILTFTARSASHWTSSPAPVYTVIMTIRSCIQSETDIYADDRCRKHLDWCNRGLIGWNERRAIDVTRFEVNRSQLCSSMIVRLGSTNNWARRCRRRWLLLLLRPATQPWMCEAFFSGCTSPWVVLQHQQ